MAISNRREIDAYYDAHPKPRPRLLKRIFKRISEYLDSDPFTFGKGVIVIAYCAGLFLLLGYSIYAIAWILVATHSAYDWFLFWYPDYHRGLYLTIVPAFVVQNLYLLYQRRKRQKS